MQNCPRGRRQRHRLTGTRCRLGGACPNEKRPIAIRLTHRPLDEVSQAKTACLDYFFGKIRQLAVGLPFSHKLGRYPLSRIIHERPAADEYSGLSWAREDISTRQQARTRWNWGNWHGGIGVTMMVHWLAGPRINDTQELAARSTPRCASVIEQRTRKETHRWLIETHPTGQSRSAPPGHQVSARRIGSLPFALVFHLSHGRSHTCTVSFLWRPCSGCSFFLLL